MTSADAALKSSPSKTRVHAMVGNSGSDADWFRIKNLADNAARVDIYDEIGLWGTSAADFLSQVRDLEVDRIDLHLNSPGGEVFDAIAILNTLRQHSAHVDVTVDGIAASSASFIAMAGDTVTMARNAELMIHSAWGLSVGDADDMRDLANKLDRVSDNIASIYAEKAGGTAAGWRDLMRAETWFTAQEAVDAGLADRVLPTKVDEKAKAKFDLKIFNYAGRAKAPAPTYAAVTPASQTPAPESASGSIPQKGQPVSFTDAQLATLRQRLGIADSNAGGDTILAALDEVLTEHADPPQSTPGVTYVAPQPQTAPASTATVPAPASVVPPELAKAANSAGAVVIDANEWASTQQKIQEGVNAAKKLREQERDMVVSGAVNDGRIPPASREYWSNLYDQDPKGTAQVISVLKKNLIPMNDIGYADMGEDDLPDEFAGLFPPATIGKGR